MKEKLKEKNEEIINNNQNNPDLIKKHLLIRNILNEKNCFLKMSMKEAYSILKDLGLSEEEITLTYVVLLEKEV